VSLLMYGIIISSFTFLKLCRSKSQNNLRLSNIFCKPFVDCDISTMSGHFLNIIEDMYNDVSLSIRLANGITQPFQTSIGVKQGCVVEPIFFGSM
jgi:hypothetical protein